MRKSSKKNCVLSLRKKLVVQAVVAVLVVAGIGIAGLMTRVEPGDDEFDMDRFLETLDLPQMAPYLASDSVFAGATDDEFGFSVAYAGDFNNDGYHDVIVGAPAVGVNDDGKAYIFYGGPNADTTADVTISGLHSGENFGYSVAGGADFDDDDEYDDIIVGAPDYGNGNSGKVYIFYGSASPSSTMDTDDADYEVTGEGDYDWLGYSVSYAGNYDNDDHDDFIAGAIGYDSGHVLATRIGAAYVILGHRTTPSSIRIIGDTGQTNGEFGRSVSYTGNADNDSPNPNDDVIIGAPYYDCPSSVDNCGRAYIFYGVDSPADTSVALSATFTTITGAASDDNLGYSVSFAGDIDNDGNNDDVIVGAPGVSTSTGKAYIYRGTISTSSTLLTGDAYVTMTGESSGANFGNAVSFAGNYNNDNYDDVIVGSYLEDTFGSGGTDAGRAHIFYGGTVMDNKVDITMVGDTSATNRYKYGFSVSNASDFDDDGFVDVIVGAPYSDSDRGYAHLYNFHDYVNKFGAVTEYAAGEKMGYSVSTAGKFNNDNYYDIIVGAPNYGMNASDPGIGRAYVFYGGDPMDNTADLTLEGEVTLDHFGWSVSSGDFNNDGYDDVIVGAPDYDRDVDSNVGRAYIYFGGQNPDTTADVTKTGENAGDKFGLSVSTAGNFGSLGMGNDDYEDAIVGAPLYDVAPNTNEGRAYIFYGGMLMDNGADVTITGETADDQFGYSVSDAGKWNNDGDGDVIVGAPYYNVGQHTDGGRAYLYYGNDNDPSVAEYTFSGEDSWNNFAFSVSTAGDVDGDDCDDIIIGAPGYNGPGDLKGRAYIFLGCDNGDETGIDVTLTGEATTGDQFGFSVSTAGDIDNDGYDDVIVGAPHNDVGGTSAGRIYIYHGGSTMNVREEVILTGTVVAATGDQLGFAVANAGDVNNDNFDDVVTGCPYSRDVTYSERGRAKVWGDPS